MEQTECSKTSAYKIQTDVCLLTKKVFFVMILTNNEQILNFVSVLLQLEN